MKTKLLLCLFTALVARGANNFVGDQALFAPYAVNESVNAVGVLTLASPGTYAAANWNIVGPLRLAVPGDYTLVATAGSIGVTGLIVGPAVGRATLRLTYQRSLNLVGVTTGGVMLIDDKAPVGPGEVVTPAAAAPLTNLSTRVVLGAGGALNVGFVVGGNAPRRVLVRAIGPGLEKFGVAGAMANPALEVFSGDTKIAGNDDWGGDAGLSATFAAAGAFALEFDSRDAAVVLTLQPGAYTVVVKGAAAAEVGELLAEVYLAP